MAIEKIGNTIIEKVDNLAARGSANKEHAEKNSRIETKNQVAELSTQKITSMVKKLNDVAKNFNERVTFDYNEKANRVIVRVVDANTNEVVREIPPKDIVKVLEHIQEYMGMLVDESR